MGRKLTSGNCLVLNIARILPMSCTDGGGDDHANKKRRLIQSISSFRRDRSLCSQADAQEELEKMTSN